MLMLAVGLAGLAILYWSRGETFYLDEWSFIVLRRPWTFESLFAPQGGHLIALPLVAFKGLLAVFGADSSVPFRLMALFFVLLNGGLLYALARRRVGPWLALLPALLLLFIGAGWEMIVSSVTLPNLMSISAGLGALLLLERGDGRGDAAACALLALSVASFSLGIVFGVIAAVEILQHPRTRLRRLWVVVVPFVLYGAWLIWARKFHQGQLDASNIGATPTAVADAASAVAASIFGLFRSPGPEISGSPDLGIRTDWGIPIAIALGAALYLRLRHGARPSPRAWALVAGILFYWILIGLGIGPARSPLASRYVYPGVLLVLLLAVELAAGLKITRGWRITLVAALAVSLLANADTIRVSGGYLRAESSYNRSQLAALELVRNQVAPGFVVEQASDTLLPHGDLFFSAADYFSATDEFGSPAYSLAELAGAGPAQRAAADQLLARALRLQAEPVLRLPTSDGRIEVAGAGQLLAVHRQGKCISLRPALGREGRVPLRLPRGGLAYRVPRGLEVHVRLSRFGDGFPVELALVSGSAVVQIPADASRRPWRALIASAAPLKACPA